MKRTSLKVVAGTVAFSPEHQAEAEFAKDIWDVRNVAGARYTDHRSDHLLNFTSIPSVFRPVVKQYLRFKLTVQQRSLSDCNKHRQNLQEFLLFYVERAAEGFTLRSLSTSDIEAYLQYLRTTANHYGRPRGALIIWEAVAMLYHFLKYLKRIDSPLAPTADIETIIWPEHRGKKPQRNLNKIKYIPLPVLEQLDKYLQYLPQTFLPVAILLRASGWRISDVLNLRHDTCLKKVFNAEKQEYEFSLIGDIQKTRILGHEIPITAEVAALVEAQAVLVREQHTNADNPKYYLFPAQTRQRQGRPLTGRSVQNALNRLAAAYEIRGEDGQIFHFGTHAFRHTKAVELINRGMPLVMVQQWMAHLSPEMTLVYAKILDDTMRKQWEKTEAKAGIRFLDGQPALLPGRQVQILLTNNTFDPLRVREHRVNTKLPVGNCVKTKDFRCRFVELPCFNCPMYVLTDEDLPWLLTYEHQLLERIAVGKQAGNTHWVEANQKLLEEKVRPAIALLQQGPVLAQEAQSVREYTLEEWEQLEQTHQEGQK